MSLGVEDLRTRHREHFSERMSRTEIILGSANKTQTCSAGLIPERLRSFGAGCKYNTNTNTKSNSKSKSYSAAVTSHDTDTDTDSNNELEELVDVNLVSQAYMYGRYLLLSAATHSPINLQGIWTDGPTSSWNGEENLLLLIYYFNYYLVGELYSNYYEDNVQPKASLVDGTIKLLYH